LRAIDEIRAFWQVVDDLFFDTLHLVRWRSGMSMPPHADNAKLNGTSNEYPYREFASVIFLNDGFNGGRLFLRRPDESRFEIEPVPGRLVLFTGGLQHVHGVTAVTSGIRYVVTGWYTRLATRAHASFWN
jgi:predicted 2-oxoglutarate/Fe(II)-dependent dioxygenase YbiX